MAIDSISTQNTNLISKTNKGYAYTDVYGFSHVVKELETASKYSGNGDIYSFEGKFGGGYALDADHKRASLNLPESRSYGNDIENNYTPNVSKGSFQLLDHLALMNASVTAAQGINTFSEIENDYILNKDKQNEDH